MREFIAQYCKQYDERINFDMFNRTFDKPLLEYVLDTIRNLEVLPAVTFTGYEYITDQTKIYSEVNKKLSKDPKIKKNRCLERLASPNQSPYDLLIVHFHLKARGQEADITRKLRVPKSHGRWYYRGGTEVLPLIQIVDNSTFVKGNILNFKTTLYPIKLYTTRQKLVFTDGETVMSQKFCIDLFKKVTNPLYYFLARYGINGTLEMFRLDRVISVVNDILDEDRYMYLKINNNMFLEVHEKAFYAHQFISRFVSSLYDVLITDKSKITFTEVFDTEYWLKRLAEIFSKKRSVDKGKRVWISFKKITDPYTKERLRLKKRHKDNTAKIIRWMMVNYDELLKKDSNDLCNKRMRVNETQAYFFDNYITRNVYSLLNTDNPPFEKYVRLLNSINEFTLLRSSNGGSDKGSATSMYRYERFNDFDAIDLSRFTLKGPTGLNGGKHKTSTRYRDIYISHLGRYDLNVCSSSDPGLTGYLTANVKFDKNGYFDLNAKEPDTYDEEIDDIIDKIADPDYLKTREDHRTYELSRGDDGFIHLRKKLSYKEFVEKAYENPLCFGLYVSPDGDGLKLMPKQERDQKGFIQLIRKTKANARSNSKKAEVELERDENGFIILKRTTTKMALRDKQIVRRKGKKKKK